MKVKLEKVYSIDFMEFTDLLCSSVSTHSSKDGLHEEYLDVRKSPVLILESDLAKFQKYGEGFRNVKFVGYIYREEQDSSVSESIVHEDIYPVCPTPVDNVHTPEYHIEITCDSADTTS